MKQYYIQYTDNRREVFPLDETPVSPGVTRAAVSGEIDYNTVNYIEFDLIDSTIPAGDEGFFLIPQAGYVAASPNTSKDYGVGSFRAREDGDYLVRRCVCPVFGVHHGGVCTVAIVTGMRDDVAWRVYIKDGQYGFRIRFILKDAQVYEAPAVEYHTLNKPDATCGDMARVYRSYQLSHGYRTIRQRLTPELKYMAESINVRIRMGWKPVPCTIYDQTEETEPPMHVACTFDDVIRIMESYHDHGIRKVEFCLVGWNMRGHDGRWPQIFPVEPALGGEEGLARVIKRARELGYAMTCHTNSTDGYSIANNFSFDDVAHKRDGSYSIESRRWAGGATYNICPKRAYELWHDLLPQVAACGFRGMQYIDVITCTPARECYNPQHPLNKRQACEYFDRLFAEAQQLFGAVGCEGPFDHSMKNCDFTLYTCMQNFDDVENAFVLRDRAIPFWQMIYHGIVVSNPYARTVNTFRASSPDDLLKVIEYGGRPQGYYYAKFVSNGTNWIGDGDLVCDTDEALEAGTRDIKVLTDIYDELCYLQYEFMEEHEELAPGVFKTLYSDGSYTVVDYNTKQYKLVKGAAG